MPSNQVRTKTQEKQWKRAKKLAQKQKPDNLYALTTSIYQNMKNKSLDQVYKSILDFTLEKGDVIDLDGDQHSKGYGSGNPLNTEPRAEIRSKMEKGEEIAGVTLSSGMNPMSIGSNEEKPPMVEHPRAGVQDMDAWYAQNMSYTGETVVQKADMVDHPRPEAKNEARIAKTAGGETGGRPNLELHESSTASKYQATQTLERSTYDMGPLTEEVNNPVSGMPEVGGMYSELNLSEDTQDPEEAMRGGFERPMWHARDVGEGDSGTPGLKERVSQVYGEDVSSGQGDITVPEIGGAAGMPGSGSTPMVDHPRPGIQKSERDWARAIASQRSVEDVGFSAGQLRPQAEVHGDTWRQGFVTYSTREDQAIERATNADGHVWGEPSLNWQAPLIKSRCCSLCKSSVPSWLTVCPECGGSEHRHIPGGVSIEKSVRDAVRGPTQGDLRFPGGTIIITDE